MANASKNSTTPNGLGLLTCGFALAVLAMLSYAVAKRGTGKPSPVSDFAYKAGDKADESWPLPPADDDFPQLTPAQAGTLQAWPAPAIDFEPPAYATSPDPRFESPGVRPESLQPEPSLPPKPINFPPYDLPPVTPPVESTPMAPPTLAEDPGPVIIDAEGYELDAEPADSSPGPILAMPPVDDEDSATTQVSTDPLFGPPAVGELTNPVDTRWTPVADQPAWSQNIGPNTGPNTGKPRDEDRVLIENTDAEAALAERAPIEDLLLDTPTPGQVSKLVTADVRAAFSLGRHGALYSARSRFIAVLRKVALAKDAAEGTDRHALALAAGLRAIDEATSFVPQGSALETDLNVAALAASHQTPLYHDADKANWVLPHEAIARYHRYAQHKLAIVAAGDQAGSMALHGLGKTYSRLDELDEAPVAGRTSLTMYRAAVEAHRGNYLAANELGVGLAKAGRYDAAHTALQQAIRNGGTSTVYRNLAVVQQNLGQTQLAAASTLRADQLAASERAAGAFSRERGVEWVAPQQFSRVADALSRQRTAGPPASNQRLATQPSAPQAEPSRRQSIADRLMPWRKSGPARSVQPYSQPTAPAASSQTIIR